MTVSATPHPLFWVAGAVTGLGQRFRENENTIFHSVDIRGLGGSVRRFKFVRAADDIAALVEQDCIGTFFFWVLTGERRLWCIARADGPHRIDLPTMQMIIGEAEPAGSADIP